MAFHCTFLVGGQKHSISKLSEMSELHCSNKLTDFLDCRLKSTNTDAIAPGPQDMEKCSQKVIRDRTPGWKHR